MLEAVKGELCLLEAMRRVLLSMLEVVEGGLCLPDVLDLLEVMRELLLCILEAVKGELCLLEAMRHVLLSMLEAVEGGLCLPKVLKMLEAPYVPEAMLYANLYLRLEQAWSE